MGVLKTTKFGSGSLSGGGKKEPARLPGTGLTATAAPKSVKPVVSILRKKGNAGKK